jgi:hypothetical protein
MLACDPTMGIIVSFVPFGKEITMKKRKLAKAACCK